MNSRIMQVTLVFFVLSALTVAHAKDKAKAKGGANAEQAITQMESELRDAALKGDPSVSQKYLSSNYVRVYPDGSTADRQQVVSDIQSKYKYSAIDVSEQKIAVTANSAVVVFKVTVKGTRDGQPIDGDYRGVRTWVKDGGHWKAVAFSTTRIASK
jgi:uncharacterized protein DUF4440